MALMHDLNLSDNMITLLIGGTAMALLRAMVTTSGEHR